MKTITVQELKTRMDAGEHINLVDVREPFENAEFNIGGQLVPLGRIKSMQADELDAMRDEEVILYCRSGARSFQACMVLEQLGFRNVVNMEGGVMAWKQNIG